MSFNQYPIGNLFRSFELPPIDRFSDWERLTTIINAEMLHFLIHNLLEYFVDKNYFAKLSKGKIVGLVYFFSSCLPFISFLNPNVQNFFRLMKYHPHEDYINVHHDHLIRHSQDEFFIAFLNEHVLTRNFDELFISLYLLTLPAIAIFHLILVLHRKSQNKEMQWNKTPLLRRYEEIQKRKYSRDYEPPGSS